ncbi:MAG: RnfABCDGE type electron transport complex subunit D [Eubacteriaceae bacterium]|nr:RnfABCDGE type electron transport complex subunit D [Eubacteriaceae bacterium]
MDKLFIVSSSPHIRSNVTTQKIMRDVLIALTPAMVAGIIYFGTRALYLTVICVITCVLTEWVYEKLMHKKSTINDLSAAVTGVLLAFNLPASASWWIAFIGSIFAILIVKQIFGGIGHNFVNPALAARAFLMTCWGVRMTGGAFIPIDAVTSATPLGILKEKLAESLPSYINLFLGTNVYGCIGEVSKLALLIGGIYLICRKVITWKIPVVYIGTVFILSLIFGQDPLFHILAGGLFLGAIFMATDYTTSPITPKGQIIYAVGCGLLTVMIRLYGAYPEGVSYSILLMNVAAPLIDRYSKPRVFGIQKVKKLKKKSEVI